MTARILVVDDSPDVLFAARRTLRRDGHTVVLARTLGEAEGQWDLDAPDLVLLDVNLPDGNGIAASNRWKAIPRRASVPIILRSSVSVSVAEQTLGLRSGADGYLVEPVEAEVLSATVAAHLRIRELVVDLARSTANAEALVSYGLQLAQATTPDAVAELLVEHALGALGASEAHVRWRGPHSRTTRSRCSVPGRHDSIAHRLALDPTGGPAVYTAADLPAHLGADQLDPAQLGPVREDHHAWAVFPFDPVAVTGAVAFAFPGTDAVLDQQQRFLTTVTSMTALSLGRAAVLDLNRSIAGTLQRALIPDPTLLPDLRAQPRLIVGEGATIAGGDWFDGYPIPSGSQAIVCGDVVGHGPEAAGASSIMRHTLRTLLLTSSDVASAIAETNRLVHQHPSRPRGSLLVAEIDAGGRTASLYSAGHPPPLLIRPGHPPAVLPVEPVPLLGMIGGSFRPTPTRVDLDAGAMLLLLTDGVVEHRGQDIDHGYARLVDAVRHAGGPDEVMLAVDRVLRETVPSDDALFAVISNAAD